MKKFSAFLMAVFFVVTPACLCGEAEVFPEDIEAILNRKIEFISPLFREMSVVSTVKKANVDHAGLSSSDILKADQDFQAFPSSSPLIQALMTNDCANQLKRFQSENKGFAEIFITDERGLNVCQTNKTSDYYQGDEDWWTHAYQNGSGKIYHSGIEYDASAQSQSISIYLPVKDSEIREKVIGIAKVVIELKVIKDEL